MILRAAIGLCAVLAVLLVVQTWRLGNCQEKAARLDTCEEVDRLEGEARDESDDDLSDRISDPE